MKTINTFIVGAPKCGTTSLANYLSTHSDVCLSNPKEPHYFSSDFKNRTLNLKSQYLNCFKENKSCMIDASTWYLFSSDAAKNIFEYNPNAKIIIMLREPSSMVFSLFLQNKFNGTENETFENALYLEAHRKLHKKSPNSKEPYKRFLYRETGVFTPQLDRYYKLFPSENIKIILFQDFVKDTNKIYIEVLDFLKLEQKLPKEGFKVYNKYKSNKSQLFKQFLAHPPLLVSRFTKFIPQTFKYKIGQILMKLNRQESSKPKISKIKEDELKAYFKPYNMQLAEKYNLNIDEWNL